MVRSKREREEHGSKTKGPEKSPQLSWKPDRYPQSRQTAKQQHQGGRATSLMWWGGSEVSSTWQIAELHPSMEPKSSVTSPAKPGSEVALPLGQDKSGRILHRAGGRALFATAPEGRAMSLARKGRKAASPMGQGGRLMSSARQESGALANAPSPVQIRVQLESKAGKKVLSDP